MLIKCDNSSVCKQVNKYLHNRIRLSNHEHSDLWNYAYELLDSMPLNHILVEWMPAHLDECQNQAKLSKFFNSGGTQCDVLGNAGADKLAKKGATSHLRLDRRQDALRGGAADEALPARLRCGGGVGAEVDNRHALPREILRERRLPWRAGDESCDTAALMVN